MRKSRFTETQIVAILKDQDAGVPTAELARGHGVHPNTLRTWRARYGGMESSDIARLKQLEEDNLRLRRIVSDLTLDLDAVKNVLAKNYSALATERRGEGLAGRRTQRATGV